MQSFINPTQVAVKIDEEFAQLLKTQLIKDLQINEMVCPTCHGMAVVIADNIYGLSDDPDKTAGLFPYKRQSLTFCPSCYNGVVHICSDCGKQLPKGQTQCDCEAESRRQRENKKQKYQEALQKAQKHESSELGGKFVMAYSDYIVSNEGYFSDWSEFFDGWDTFVSACKSAGFKAPERPEYVWGTQQSQLQLDANDIVERACEDMYEDAIFDIGSSAIKEMQDYLDTWKYRYGVTSYYEDYRHAIRIPWEEDKQ